MAFSMTITLHINTDKGTAGKKDKNRRKKN